MPTSSSDDDETQTETVVRDSSSGEKIGFSLRFFIFYFIGKVHTIGI